MLLLGSENWRTTSILLIVGILVVHGLRLIMRWTWVHVILLLALRIMLGGMTPAGKLIRNGVHLHLGVERRGIHGKLSLLLALVRLRIFILLL